VVKLLRLLRYDWPVHIVLLLTNPLPDNVPFLRLRGALVRWFLRSCGRNLQLGRNVTFYNPAKIVVGSNVYIAYGCWFMAGDQITVQDEVLFGPYCVIVSSNHNRKDGSFRNARPRRAPIKVGAGSWMAAHVVLTGGSTVGNGSMIAAGAVVTGDIPDHTMAGGVPARVLKEILDECA